MISYYVQLREYIRSSTNCSVKQEHEADPERDPRRLAAGVTCPVLLAETTVPNTIAQKNATPAQAVDLTDAFEAESAF
jgi:hypothetical protein